MDKNFEYDLPLGYKEAKVIDAKKLKLGIILNLIALLVLAVTVGIAVIIIKPQDIFEKLFMQEGNFAQNIVRLLVYIAILFGYIVLHELTHGLAYKILTKQKLTFGITLTVAYCGVPDIFVYRKAALIAVLAPFVVFIPVFLAPMFFLALDIDKIFCAFMLGMHIGGCSGDLYVTLMYLFKFKDPLVLMRDTGPTQTFYVKDAQEESNP